MKYFIFIFSIIFLLVSPVCAGSQQTSSATAQTIIDRARYQLNEQTADFWDDEELLVWLNDGMIDIVCRSLCLETTYDIMLGNRQLEYSIPDPIKYVGVIDTLYLKDTGRFFLLQQNGDYLLQQNGDKLIIGASYGTYKKGLIPGEMAHVGHIEDVGEPVHWYEWNDNVGFYPLIASEAALLRQGVSGNALLQQGKGYILQQGGGKIFISNGYGGYILQQGGGKILISHVQNGAVRLFLIKKPDRIALTDNVLTPACYDYALELYIIAQALYKDSKIVTGKQLTMEYLEEIERFKTDFVKKGEDNVS